MVHGFRGDHHGLAQIALRIRERQPELSIIVPDLPGFGQTPSTPGATHTLSHYGQWLAEFARTVAPAHNTVALAHSFGTLVLAEALTHGFDPRSIALVNPISSRALQGPKKVMTQLAVGYYRAAEVLPEAIGRSLLSNRAIVRVMSETMAKTGDRRLRAWIHEQHSEFFSSFDNRETLLEAFEASVSHTVREYADSFRAPTALICGAKDEIAPLESQLALEHALAAHTPTQLYILPQTGHLSHYETPDEISEISTQWWLGCR